MCCYVGLCVIVVMDGLFVIVDKGFLEFFGCVGILVGLLFICYFVFELEFDIELGVLVVGGECELLVGEYVIVFYVGFFSGLCDVYVRLRVWVDECGLVLGEVVEIYIIDLCVEFDLFKW